jgi:hypothetical protein
MASCAAARRENLLPPALSAVTLRDNLGDKKDENLQPPPVWLAFL